MSNKYCLVLEKDGNKEAVLEFDENRYNSKERTVEVINEKNEIFVIEEYWDSEKECWYGSLFCFAPYRQHDILIKEIMRR